MKCKKMLIISSFSHTQKQETWGTYDSIVTDFIFQQFGTLNKNITIHTTIHKMIYRVAKKKGTEIKVE